MFPCSHSLFPSPSSGNSSCPLIGPPTEPRFESRRCDLCQSQEEKQTDLPTHLKVANRSELEAEGSPARAGAERSEREKGGNYALGIPKGRSPWRAFGDFLRDGKVTRGGGAERPPHGGRGGRSPHLGRSEEPSLTTCSWRGAAPPRIGGSWGSQPRTNSRVLLGNLNKGDKALLQGFKLLRILAVVDDPPSPC